MSSLNHIDALIAEVSAAIRVGEWWDFDEGMPTSRAAELSYGRLVLALHDHDAAALQWLTYFVARRALSCWELGVDDDRPRDVVASIGAYLDAGRSPNWAEAMRTVASPFADCQYSETQSAADCVAECARYIALGDPLQAVCCISSADMACDHVLTEHHFREWLVNVAVPVALEKREMREDEREGLRP